MNNIRIYKLPLSFIYTDLLIPLSSENPLSLIYDLAVKSYLSELSGKVLVDNIFRTGNNNRRFFELTYENGKIDFETLKFINLDRKNNIRVTSNKYLKELPEYVENSILNLSQKQLLLKGISI